jgi:peroxiredoxin
MARRWVAWSCVAVLNTLGSPSDGGPLTPAQLATLNLGSYPPATTPPEFSGRTAEERIVSVAGLRGKVVLLNFWATWCLECRPEMPAFEELHRKFGVGGLTIVGINAREEKETVQKYARELGLTFPLVLDPQGKINSLYGVIGLPTTFLIGRDGRVVALAIGPRNWRSHAAEAIIQALLSDPPPGADVR